VNRSFRMFTVAALVAAGAAAATPALELSGDFIQGGLLQGRAAPGSRVEIDGHRVAVSPEGIFLVGFGRDAATRARLSVTGPDGARSEREIEIAARDYDVQRVDGLPAAKVSPGALDMQRIRRESALIAAARGRRQPRTDFLGGFGWPLEGRLSGVYGSQRILNGKPRRAHGGVDIAAPVGTPVRAPADGVVSLAHEGMFFTGKTLMIDHGLGLSSVFAHLSRIRVAVGARVTRGQIIAEVGATGRVTGPHLHWGVSLGTTRLDPALLTGPMP